MAPAGDAMTRVEVFGSIFISLFIVSHCVAILSCARSGRRVAVWAVIAAGGIAVAAAFAGIGAHHHVGAPVILRAGWAAVVMLISWPLALAAIAVCSVAAYFLLGRNVTVAVSVGSSFSLDLLYLLSQFAEMH
jgi:hypothetical protein